MTYAKLIGPAARITEALTDALEQFGLGGETALVDLVQPSLEAAGACVVLECDREVWVSSIVFDRPETLQVDFLTVAIAHKDGRPWRKANGQLVANVFWHGLFPDVLASLGIGTARKALMMVALGQPQPQVPVEEPGDGPAMRDAIPLADPFSRCISGAITAALEIEAPPEDVL